MTMQGLTPILWTLLLVVTKCSMVIDKQDQDGIYLSEYCPKMPYCAEGTHIMCMYYNPNRVAGPRCSNFQNVSISNEIANKLLDLVNEMRGQVALGKETGKGNASLPRGYGLFKLKWDNELATFAQVLANTCSLRHDLCRATKKFHDPGQLASLVRFTIPDWFPVLHRQLFVERGLTMSKIEYAAKEAYKAWYQYKQFVTPEVVKNVPDWQAQPTRTQGIRFLQLVHGKATHMGCGLSAYVEYGYQGQKVEEIVFNSVQIICNFSTQPRKDTAVYDTNHPGLPGYSKCGCPPGTEEDERCLCSDAVVPAEVPEPTCSQGSNCKPAVVLLPIFTVEDAPPKSAEKIGLENLIELAEDRRRMMSNPYANPLAYPAENSPFSPIHDDLHRTEYRNDNTKLTPHYLDGLNVKSIYLDDNESKRSLASASNQDYGRDYSRRKSPTKSGLFSKPSIQRRVVKKVDVVVRKDFSKAQQLLNTYLNEKKNRESLRTSDVAVIKTPQIPHLAIQPKYRKPVPVIVTELTTTTQKTTPTPPQKEIINVPKVVDSDHHEVKNTKDVKVADDNHYESKKGHYEGEKDHHEAKTDNDGADKKFMTLLDTLEQEVQYADLDVNEKEIFDAKIRKIYGAVVAKTADLRHYSDSDSLFSETDRTVTETDDLEMDEQSFEGRKAFKNNKVSKTARNIRRPNQNKYADLHERRIAIGPLKYNNLVGMRNRKLKKSGYNENNRITDSKSYKNDAHALKAKLGHYKETKNRHTYDIQNAPKQTYHDRKHVHLKDDFHDTSKDNKEYHDIRNQDVHETNKEDFHDARKDNLHDKRKDIFHDRISDNDKELDYSEEDHLDPERKKFYEEKLAHLERKLHYEHKHHGPARGHKKVADHLEDTHQDRVQIRPSKHNKTPMNMYLTPDRGRFIHGY